jgi:hypothetical protein
LAPHCGTGADIRGRSSCTTRLDGITMD